MWKKLLAYLFRGAVIQAATDMSNPETPITGGSAAKSAVVGAINAAADAVKPPDTPAQ